MRLTQPQDAELLQLQRDLAVALVSYDRDLVRLRPNELLPRYNRILLDITNNGEIVPDRVFLTVRRDGSKIGSDNFYTVPLELPALSPKTRSRYSILSFDSFNLPFTSVRVTLTTPDEYAKRKVSKAYLVRARELATLISAAVDVS